MEHLSFSSDLLNEPLSIDMTLEQAIFVAKLVAFFIDADLDESSGEGSSIELYETFYRAIEPFGSLTN